MAMTEKYANVEVSCTNKNMGCTWKGLLNELDEHTNTCDKDLLIQDIIMERLEARFKDEMDQLKEKNKEENEALKAEIKKMKEEFNEGITKLKEENEKIKEEIGRLRNELGDSAGKKVPQNITPTTTPKSSVNQNLNNPTVETKVYLDLANGDEPLGRVIIKLFTTQAPQSCTKFLKLCTHETGVGYKGSVIYGIDRMYIGMGHENNITYLGRYSAFPPEFITPVENLSAKHDKHRLVCLHNWSGFTESYFCFMARRYPKWDGVQVLIGEVTEETWFAVEKIRELDDINTVKIAGCGVI